MAPARRLIVLALLAACRATIATAACDEERALTGLGLAVRSGALEVAEVVGDSAASRAGFRPGDVVVQANDALPRTCAQWARAVDAARDGSKALLVLVRRGEAEVALALGSATWQAPGVARAPLPGPGREPAPSPEPAPPPRVDAPARTAPPPPPPPLPPEAAVSLDGVLRDLAALAPLDDPPASLPVYREAVTQARRQIETLSARGLAPDDVVGELRGVSRYHEGAVVAWEAIEGRHAEERTSRRLPVPDNLAVPWFGDSPVAALLEEFDFLDATVARQPRGGRLAETSGLWRPVWARLLLWERGAWALDALRDRLGGSR